MKSKGKIATTIVIALLCTALVATAGFALAEREDGKQSARVGAAYGGAALGEFSMALAEMDETLSQAVYATDGALLAGLCSRAAANAASALTAMSSLPADTQELERMAGYINGAGDFLLYLARSASRGALPDDALRGGLAEIAGGIAVLAEGAERILTEHMDGALEMDEYAASPAEAEGESVGTELAALEDELPEFPALDYDGAYSVSAQGREAKYLEGKGEVSEATARAAAAEFLGLPQTRLASAALADSAVPCYVFPWTIPAATGAASPSASAAAWYWPSAARASRRGPRSAWTRPRSARPPSSNAAAGRIWSPSPPSAAGISALSPSPPCRTASSACRTRSAWAWRWTTARSALSTPPTM